ncbi:MAG: PQQ-dependent sugar dehydrogenase [Pseudonocardiaceae bacterium]
MPKKTASLRRGIAVSALLLLAACGTGNSGSPDRGDDSRKRETGVVARDLQVPWALDFLPDGTALVTERNSRMISTIAPDGTTQAVQRLSEVGGGGEGGLLGIAVSPRYDRDQTVFVYYTTDIDNRIARLRLGQRPEPILTGIPAGSNHNGGRLAFGPDGYLYAGTGDAGDRSRSQNVGDLGGKILRLTGDGASAAGNPFPGSPVYSFGHRNVQGLAWDSRHRLYASEFGQNRFDELNRIEPGSNYGWPNVEGRGGGDRYVAPIATWPTSEASPSGIAISADIVVLACLRGERLWLVQLDKDGNTEGDPRAILDGAFGRLRDVAVAPDGSLWTTTSNRDGRGSARRNDDAIIRIPASAIADTHRDHE